MSTSDAQRLLAAAAELDRHPGSLSDADAQEFLTVFPLPHILEALNQEQLSPAHTDLIYSALSKVFHTPYGTALLPQAASYAPHALQSPKPQLRRLACEQLGRLLLEESGQQGDQVDMAASLLQVLGDDPDTGVAAAAERALQRYGARSLPHFSSLLDTGNACGRALLELVQQRDATVRMRVLGFLVAAAAGSAQAAQLLKQSGLPKLLLQEVEDTSDALSCMAALALLQQLAEQQAAGMGTLLADLAMGRVTHLAADPLLRASALATGAALLAAALRDGAAAMDVDGQRNGHPLLQVIADMLDEAGDEGPDAEVAALDAASLLGVSRQGAELMAMDASGVLVHISKRALGRAPQPEVRLAALHALASVAGAERAGESKCRDDAMLSDEAEDALRQAVYQAAAYASGTKLPADVLAQLLQQPTSEMRVAAYRLTMALGFRPWCAAHLLSTPAAVDRLLDASSETGKANCEWRHSCVLALSAAVQATQELPAGHPEAAHAAVLLGAFGRVSAAVRGGPFGGGPALTQADHIVATEAR